MGDWFAGASLPHRMMGVYVGGDFIDVIITSPTEGATLTDASPTIIWNLASGTQQSFRVEVFDDDGAGEPDLDSVAYDSGVLAGAVQSHTIPEGNLQSSQTYHIRVSATTTDGDTGTSIFVEVTTSFEPSGPVQNLAVVSFGDKCDMLDEPDLPHNRVTWTLGSPGPTESFVRFSVWRRRLRTRRHEAGQGPWTRIASIDDEATELYDDYNVASYTTYEYAVTWTALDSILGTVVGVRQDPPVEAEIEFDWIFIHDELTPVGNSVIFFSLEADSELVQEPTRRRAWGNAAPTTFFGQANFREINLSGLSDLHRSDFLQDVVALMRRQVDEGSTLVLRRGYKGDIIFGAATGLDEDSSQEVGTPDLEFAESNFDEAVD